MWKCRVRKSACVMVLTRVTLKLAYWEEPEVGQYWEHLTFIFSTRLVSITTVGTLWSQIMRQKSLMVSGRGPWAAMYSFLRL